MIIRKTASVKRKKMITDRFDDKTQWTRVKVSTYWFLFIPVYTKEDAVLL